MAITEEEFNRLRDKCNGCRSATTEHALQTSCVVWFRYAHPDLIIMSIPNGAKRTFFERRQAKEEGLTAGIPDLFIPHPVDKFHGLWIEMKNGKAGRLTDSQKQMITRLRNEDYAVDVCRSFEEFQCLVEDYVRGKYSRAYAQ